MPRILQLVIAVAAMAILIWQGEYLAPWVLFGGVFTFTLMGIAALLYAPAANHLGVVCDRMGRVARVASRLRFICPVLHDPRHEFDLRWRSVSISAEPAVLRDGRPVLATARVCFVVDPRLMAPDQRQRLVAEDSREGFWEETVQFAFRAQLNRQLLNRGRRELLRPAAQDALGHELVTALDRDLRWQGIAVVQVQIVRLAPPIGMQGRSQDPWETAADPPWPRRSWST
jgi:hypothetical protein